MKCNTCQADGLVPFYKKNVRLGTTAGFESNYTCALPSYRGIHFDLWKCPSCQLVLAQHGSSPKVIEENYAASRDPHYAELASFRYKNFQELFQDIAPHCSTAPRRVLDVGANKGIFLKMAKDQGLQVAGCELNREAAEFAQRNYAISLNSKPLLECDFSPSSFDMVTLFDVVEHLVDPRGTLEACHTLLRDGAVLAITTPNLESLSAKVLRTKWWCFCLHHLFYYSESSLKTLLENLGFEFLAKKRVTKAFPISYYLSNIEKVQWLGRIWPAWADAKLRMSFGDMLVLARKR